MKEKSRCQLDDMGLWRGFQLRLGDMNDWLDREVGRGNYALHGSGRRLPDASAFYFRSTEAAFRFTEAFPDLALDDRTGGHRGSL